MCLLGLFSTLKRILMLLSWDQVYLYANVTLFKPTSFFLPTQYSNFVEHVLHVPLVVFCSFSSWHPKFPIKSFYTIVTTFYYLSTRDGRPAACYQKKRGGLTYLVCWPVLAIPHNPQLAQANSGAEQAGSLARINKK